MTLRRLVAVSFALLLLVAAAPAAVPACCVTGTYLVTFQDLAAPDCPQPGRGEFVADLIQRPDCGPEIHGSAVRPGDRARLVFKGRIVARTDKCCSVEGVWRLPEGTATVRVHFCWRDGELKAKGKAAMSDGCVAKVELFPVPSGRP